MINFAVYEFPRTKLLLDLAISKAILCQEKLGYKCEVKIGDNYRDGSVVAKSLQSSAGEEVLLIHWEDGSMGIPGVTSGSF